MDAATQETLKPFFWVEVDGSASLCLNIGEFKHDVFEARADEGFLGNGYDWASLAREFVDEQMPHIQDAIDFDPEADMFVAYASDPETLEQFALGFRAMCDDDTMMRDLFSRAEID